jgi:hypothetical protein
MGSKRKLEDSISPPSWWTILKEDMIVHGGILHDSLGFCPETRELKVIHEPSSSETAAALSSNGDHRRGDNDASLVMRIPKSSIITQDLALRLILPWWPEVETNLQSLRDSGKLYASVCNILIAVALAFVGSSLPSSSKEDRLARAYLATLPDSSSYWDCLPRRWSDEQLKALLQGSTVLNRARHARKRIERDFSLLQNSFLSKNDDERQSFPVPFEKFSNMYAAVSSRAFSISSSDSSTAAGLQQEQEDVLIPILDLCDHCRGTQEGQNKKNISYDFQDGYMVVRSVAEDDSVTTKDPSNTMLPLPVGEALRITYGAQGNPQLLYNYGFAIQDNLEPDGSSNDVLEFTVKDKEGTFESTILYLRMGPKSYTYGYLIKALEFFRPQNQNTDNDDERGEEEDQDDMEAFLAGGDDNDNDDDDDIDLYGDTESPAEESHEQDAKDEATNDLAALSIFEQALQEKLKQYKLDDATLSKRIAEEKTGPEYYSAILLHSEKKTLRFFLTAVRKITNMLQPEAPRQPLNAALHGYAANDLDLMESQADELAKAYITIRHSDEYV